MRPLRLGVVSDTHMPRFGRDLPAPLREGLGDAHVDLIVHLGDLMIPDVITLLERIAPVEAVAGNNDPEAVVARFGRRRAIEIGGIRIGLVHGDEGRGPRTVDRAANAFGVGTAACDVSAILFGHSHVPLVESRDGVLLMNPGSPTDKRRQPLFSYGLLDVLDDGGLEPRILTYADRRAR